MRYERKYRIEAASYDQVFQTIMNLPGAFSEAYPDRWINSIYLDTLDFDALNENLAGISQRSKYRIRWYGDSIDHLSDPILEEKIKDNMLGTKKYSKLESVPFTKDGLSQLLSIPILQDKNLRPVALIRYRRTYLESFDHMVRATIDQHLSYYGINNYSLDPFPQKDEAIILEVKYDKGKEEILQPILQAIPYRLTKNSKFVSGVLGYWS